MSDQIPEAVAERVAALTRAVEDVRAGLIDEDAVRRITAEVVAADRAQANPAGYNPDDYAPDLRAVTGTPEQRYAQYVERDASRVAPLIRRDEAEVREFQRLADDVVLLDAIMSKGGREPYDVRESSLYRDQFAPALRALDTQTTNEGVEWVPRLLSASLIERVNLQLRVAALFPMVTMPSNPFDLPAVGVSRVRTGIHAEQTADSGQDKFKVLTPGTRKVTLTAKKFAGRVLVSREAEEDEIVAVLPWIASELVDFISADIEDAVINGDAQGAHMDVDVTASDDVRKAWDGLRAAAIAASATLDGGSNALTVDDLRLNRKEMLRYGIDPTKLAHVVSMSGYIDLLADDDVITIDKLGSQATILTGQLAQVDGAPVIVSEYVRQDLNATGVYDGTTTTQSLALTVHRGGFIMGEKRGLSTEYLRELYAESDQDAVIASTRKAFSKAFDTQPVVAYTYNIDA